jgi:hypothetical protein
MHLPEQLVLPALLRYVTDTARDVHIRLALTLDQNKKWLARNLVRLAKPVLDWGHEQPPCQ